VTTIECLAGDGAMHPVQTAFIDAEAVQCIYYTPGMLLAAVGLLRLALMHHDTRRE
jgi:aerobic-type carbon monoxide dehydrogenase small subunit (CoxS/CutS family)